MPEAEIPNLIPAMPEMFLVLAAMGLLHARRSFQRDGDGAAAIRFNRLMVLLGILTLLLTLLLVVTIAAARAAVVVRRHVHRRQLRDFLQGSGTACLGICAY